MFIHKRTPRQGRGWAPTHHPLSLLSRQPTPQDGSYEDRGHISVGNEHGYEMDMCVAEDVSPDEV